MSRPVGIVSSVQEHCGCVLAAEMLNLRRAWDLLGPSDNQIQR